MGMPEEKTVDIFRIQLSKLNGTVTKAIDNKTLDEIPIPATRYCGAAAFLCEINFVPGLKHSQRRFVNLVLWKRNETLASEMIEKTIEGAYITATPMFSQISLGEKPVNNTFR